MSVVAQSRKRARRRVEAPESPEVEVIDVAALTDRQVVALAKTMKLSTWFVSVEVLRAEVAKRVAGG